MPRTTTIEHLLKKILFGAKSDTQQANERLLLQFHGKVLGQEDTSLRLDEIAGLHQFSQLVAERSLPLVGGGKEQSAQPAPVIHKHPEVSMNLMPETRDYVAKCDSFTDVEARKYVVLLVNNPDQEAVPGEDKHFILKVIHNSGRLVY